MVFINQKSEEIQIDRDEELVLNLISSGFFLTGAPTDMRIMQMQLYEPLHKKFPRRFNTADMTQVKLEQIYTRLLEKGLVNKREIRDESRIFILPELAVHLVKRLVNQQLTIESQERFAVQRLVYSTNPLERLSNDYIDSAWFEALQSGWGKEFEIKPSLNTPRQLITEVTFAYTRARTDIIAELQTRAKETQLIDSD